MEVQKAQLHQQICFYISFAFVKTRFKVGFGVGHISNMIEHKFLATIPGYFNPEPPQYVPEAT